VAGRFLLVDGQRFWVKGVTYGTFRPNARGEPYPDPVRVRMDFLAMRAAGVNTVRLYTPPPDWLADHRRRDGVVFLLPMFAGDRVAATTSTIRSASPICASGPREHSRRLADHPAMLLFSLGNEIPPLMVRWYWQGAHRGVPPRAA
jgi:beta-galactosidase/beta-glucuronidase